MGLQGFEKASAAGSGLRGAPYRLRLGTAFSLFLGMTTAAFLALALALMRVTDLLDEEARTIGTATESIRVAEELKSELLLHNREANRQLLRGEALGPQDLGAIRAKTFDLLGAAQKSSRLEDEGRLLEEMKRAVADYYAMRDDLDSDAPPLEQYAAINRYIDRALEHIDRFVEFNAREAQAVQARAEAQNRLANRTGLALILFSALTGSAVFAAAALMVYRPLAALKQDIAQYQDNGLPVGASVRGVVEIREIALAFNEMARQLEERRRDLLRFIASTAHDLRTPLAAISVAAQLAERGSGSQDPKLLGIIQKQIAYLDGLVTDLLEISRIEAGQLRLNFAEEDVRALVKNAVELHRSSTELHSFETIRAESPVFCSCDAGRLSQVLNNLLSNAIKYSPNGGRITVSVAQDGNSCLIEVADEGIGIDEDDLKHIFKAFHRSKATMNTIPGIGLGLSASRRIVEAHGGAITARGKPARGAIFSVRLPLSRTVP